MRSLTALIVLASATAVLAQRGWGRYRMPPKFPVEHPTHRDFTFSRVLYQSSRWEPGGGRAGTPIIRRPTATS